MKIVALLLIAAVVGTGSLFAQAQRARSINLDVETKWPGVVFSISRLERIQDTLLQLLVRVIATAEAAPSGNVLVAVSMPHENDQPDFKPFTLISAVMTDDQTQQKYSVLRPVAPDCEAYFPDELVNT